jgi:hypothetical protein
MKVQHIQTSVSAMGTGDEHTAKIKGSAKAFQILSGSLYSDKILAVVRELSCNAYDAHVANGNPDTPFEIKLPTNWDATFYVKDFGTGLSDDQVKNLYMTYFDSSKQDSDDFVGQLGLGSKSPFSYGATFNVESRFNGIKSVYTCYKNTDGVPSVRSMGSAATDEPNGVTISLGVKSSDIAAFQRATKFALMYFNVQPNYVGMSDFTAHPVKYTAQGNGWKMRSGDSVYDGVRVVQGGVSYPVNIETVHELLNDSESAHRVTNFMRHTVSHLNLDILVNIGDVEIAPSREALTYDVRTAENLVQHMTDVEYEMRKSIVEELNAAPTFWHAFVLYNKMTTAYSNRDSEPVRALVRSWANSGFKFEYKGRDLTTSPRMLAIGKAFTTLSINVFKGSHRRTKLMATEFSFDTSLPGADTRPLGFTPNSEHVVVIDDLNDDRSMRARLNDYLWAYQRHPAHKQAYVISKGINAKAVDKKELAALLEFFGNPETVLLSSFAVPAKAPSTYKYKAKATDELMVWKQYRSSEHTRKDSVGPLCWTTEKVDLTEGGLYISVERNTIVDNRFRHDRFDSILLAARELGIIDATASVYGLSDKKLAQVSSKGEWVNVMDLITTYATKNGSGWNDMLAHRALYDWARGRSSVYSISANWSTEYDIAVTNNQSFVDFFTNINTILSTPPTDHVANLIQGLRIVIAVDSAAIEVKRTALADAWAKILLDNPMLEYVSLSVASNTEHGRQLISRAITK